MEDVATAERKLRKLMFQQGLVLNLCLLFQVMLLANPSLEELYHKSCALAEDSQEVRESFQHPARLIKVCQTLFKFILLIPEADSDVLILFHCWELTMWKYPNWCCVNNTGSVFSSACGSSEVWLFVLPAAFLCFCFLLCFCFCFVSASSSPLFKPLPILSFPHFHLTCVLWLSFGSLFFCFPFSFWWAWEVKTRPWPLVVTGLPLWMERTQRRIRLSLLRQPYAVARPSQALTLVCAHSGKHYYSFQYLYVLVRTVLINTISNWL